MEKKKGVLYPDYEDDIFISYTHIDNDKYAKDHQGWVDYMHERLERRLAQLLGEHPTIWRDPKLSGNDFFGDTLIVKLQKIAILVAVLSPRYVKSEWCLKELKEFYQNAMKSDDFKRKAPIFKVVKTPVEESLHPEELRDLLGYKFYEEDPLNGQPHEFSHDMAFPSYPKFVQKVDDLAWDIKLFIKSLESTPSGRLASPVAKTIYLAETAPDVEKERDRIRRELQSRGHCVLPDKDFPSDPAALEEAIREDLERAHLSIHLVGEKYDDPTGQRSRSVVELQYDLAVERGENDPRFAQVVWLPKWLCAKDDDQQRLIQRLRHEASKHPGVEVLRDKLEDLKTNVLTKLNKMPGVVESGEPREVVRVYLIHDNQDYEAVAPLYDFLHQQKLEIILPVLSGPADEVSQAHRESLADCDAAIIFYGQSSEMWLHQKLRDLRKASSTARAGELLGSCLFISGPLTKQKEYFMSWEMSVVKDRGAFPPDGLLDFVGELGARAGARKLRAKGVGR